MKLAFSGPRVSGHNEELDTSGGTGTAIVVQAAGKNVSFDGTEGDANTLKDGDNVLHLFITRLCTMSFPLFIAIILLITRQE